MKPNRHTLSMHDKQRSAAFSLLEIALVLAIIGLIIGMSVGAMDNVVKSARIVSTKEKMKALDDALHSFWLANHRLPCPANASLAVTDANYGVEAANNNSGCSGGTPAANKVFYNYYIQTIEGMVPFATLGIPESYAYDGWNRRVTYATESSLTKTNAALQTRPETNCRYVGVEPYEPTRHHAYVLISHGENGFGARTKSGSEILKSGAGTVDGINAHRNTSSPYAATLYMGNYSTVYDDPNSDDILSGKTIPELFEGVVYEGLIQDRSSLFLSSSKSPYVHHYAWDGDSFTKQADFSAGLPSGQPQGKIAAPVEHANCHRQLLYTLNNAASSLAQCQFEEHDGTYNNINCTPSTAAGTGNFLSAAYYHNPHGTAAQGYQGEMAFTYGSNPYIHFGKPRVYVSGGTYLTGLETGSGSAYQPNTAPTGAANSSEYSPVTGHLAVAHADASGSSPYKFVSIYNRSTADGYARELITTAPDVQPGGGSTAGFTGNDVAYSPDGRYLAVAHDSSPYLTIYSTSATVYTKIKDPATLPTGNANGISFSSDGRYLAVAHNTTPYITVYKVNKHTDTFTKLDNPTNLPAGTAHDIDFACGLHKFAVAVTGTSTPTITPGLRIYDIEHGEVVVNATNTDEMVTTSTGHAVEFADCPNPIPDNGLISTGLIGHWWLNDGSGTTAVDASNSSNDGTLNGDTYWTSLNHDVLGTSSGTAVFDGSGDYIMSGVGTAFTFPMTLMAWVKLNNTNNQAFITLNNGVHTFTGFGMLSSIPIGYLEPSNFQYASTAISAGQWYHLAVVYPTKDAADAVMYIDGEDKSSATPHTGATFSPTRVTIGSGRDGTNYFLNGQMDDVRVYNRVVTPDEMKRIAAGDG